MNKPRRCRQCNCELLDKSTMPGICPSCLLTLGLDASQTSPSGGTERTIPRGSPHGSSAIPATLSHYRLVARIKGGGQGEVYRAMDERLGREVAIKILPAGALADEVSRKRFFAEAKTLSMLNHERIATVYDFDTQDDIDFLVMEYVVGEDLKEHLRQGPLAIRDVVRLGIQLCDALMAAHSRGIVHRDLKPGNLMVTTDNQLKVLDFGLAKHLEPTSETESIVTTSGGVWFMGTLPYAAPEQLLGDSTDVRTDIHACGTVLYEMATGKRPFDSPALRALMREILEKHPQPPQSVNSALPKELSEIILKCLRKRPQDRFQSAYELRAALHRLETATARWERMQREKRKRRIRVTLLVALGVIAIGALVRLALQPPPRGILVLPFDTLGDETQRYYADAITNQLISKLVTLPELRVISWTSASTINPDRPLSAIAEEFDANAVIEGTLVRSQNRLQINMRMIQLSSRWMSLGRQEETLLSVEREFYDHDLFKTIGGFAADIAESLAVKLLPEERRHLEDEEEIIPAAFEAYARGRQAWERRNAAVDSAIYWYEISIREDSTFALSYSGLADCYALFGSIGYDIAPPTRAMPIARSYVRKALDHDSLLAQAHTAMAHIHHNYDWDWEKARTEFEYALRLSPSYPTTYQWYGFYLTTMGRIDDGIRFQRQGLGHDPKSAVLLASLARLHYYKRDFPAALDYANRALALDASFLPAMIIQGVTYVQMSRYRKALDIFKYGHELTTASVFLAGIGATYAAAGEREQALRVAEELQVRPGYVPAFYIAAIYAQLGEADRAFEWLDHAYEERSEILLYLLVDPICDPLRGDARFDLLVQRIGLPGSRG